MLELCFALLSRRREQTSRLFETRENQLQKHMKRFELSTEMKLYDERVSLNGIEGDRGGGARGT